MTIQERIEKLKQARELIDEVLSDPGSEEEMGEEAYSQLQEGDRLTYRAYLKLKVLRSRQPLGVK